jgi:transcriptional regulator with PAS, ATPase and Fis domain
LLYIHTAMITDIYQIIFSNCNEMNKIKAIIEEIAKTDITVLITGESGTGKGLLAEAIHLNSLRKDKPFVRVNCAAVPKGLLESELFGFSKDAYAGVHVKKPGKFELANGGTILLKDIGKLDIFIQAKLVQLLRDNTFSHLSNPIEGDGVKAVAPRVLLTINDRLEKSIEEGHFYDDLFSKIHFVSIRVPPLRDRKEQIPSLSQYYFDFYKEKYGRDVSAFSSKIMYAFGEYDWPGNIDELENMIKRIVIAGDGDGVLQTIFSSRLDEGVGLGFYENSSINSAMEKKLFTLRVVKKQAAEAAEAEMIKGTLEETRWNRKRAAKLLGISYNALLYKIHKYNLV